MLDDGQKKIIENLKDGKNVMMLGIAGSGKSYLINNLQAFLPNKKVYLTSTTGVSAININGSTVHSFFGVGLGVERKEILYDKMKYYKKVVQRLVQDNIIIVIDEVSMLTADLLTKIDYILRKTRRTEKIFGGVQFLFSGDFLQLETIDDENILDNELIKDFSIIQLKNNYRQENDVVFQDILQNLRYNQLTEEQINILKSKEIKEKDIDLYDDYPLLFPLTKQVKKYNKIKYEKINADEKIYGSEVLGKCQYSKKKLDDYLSKKDSKVLKLKAGTRVMLTWNLDTENKLVNGSVGTVEEVFQNQVIVNFDDVGKIIVTKQTWNVFDENGKILATAKQIPLVVCYALTIHKCQGVSLPKAIIDIKDCFCNHQVYVALSRVRSLDGLKLLNFDQDKILVNDFIVDFYKKL